MSIFAQYGGGTLGTADTTAKISEGVWKHCPFEDIILRGKGIYFRDDFGSFRDVAAAEVEAATNGYGTIVATGCTISQVATDPHGTLRIAMDGTADDEGGITTGNNTAPIVHIDKNSNEPMWFEARLRSSDITTAHAFFVGLSKEGGVTTDAVVVDGNASLATTLDLVGFRTLGGDPDGLDAIHQTAAGAAVVVKDVAQVMVASTWYKVGIYFDGKETVRFYVDGVEVGSADVDDTNFTEDNDYALLAIIKSGAAAVNFDLGWWQVAQLYA